MEAIVAELRGAAHDPDVLSRCCNSLAELSGTHDHEGNTMRIEVSTVQQDTTGACGAVQLIVQVQLRATAATVTAPSESL